MSFNSLLGVDGVAITGITALLTFLMTAIIVSLLNLLLTWCWLVRRREKKAGAPIAPDPVYMEPMRTVPPHEDSDKIFAAMGYEYMQHQPSTPMHVYDSVGDN